MRAFLKTLVGDARNLAVVGILMVAEVALVFGGHADAAVFAIPPLALAGMAWLARC
jgi:hypothetical protein